MTLQLLEGFPFPVLRAKMSQVARAAENRAWRIMQNEESCLGCERPTHYSRLEPKGVKHTYP